MYPTGGLKKRSMHMFYMLPHKGMCYQFWVVSLHVVTLRADTTRKISNLPFFEKVEVVNNDKICVEKRILPPNMSTKIMSKFNQTHNQPNKQPTRKNFDQAIAELFDKGERVVLKLGLSGKLPSYDSDFWHIPKIGTFLENISDQSTSHFLAKILEGRESHLKDGSAGRYDCETAKAIDRFKQAVQIASVTGSGVDALMKDAYPESAGFSVAAYMVDQFDSDDDTDSEDSDNEAEPGDDEAPAAKRVKLEMSPPTDGQTHAFSALVDGTVPLAFRGRAPEGLDGANKDIVGDTIDYRPFLEQMAKEDEAQLDEEGLMELEGN